MDKFINIFVEIDLDNNGAITVDNLERFCAVNKLDKGMVETWITLFDNQHTGQITQEKFCEVLGLAPEQMEEARSRRSSLACSSAVPQGAPQGSRKSSVVILENLEEAAQQQAAPQGSRRSSGVILEKIEDAAQQQAENKSSRRHSSVVLERPTEVAPQELETKGSRRASVVVLEPSKDPASAITSRRSSTANSDRPDAAAPEESENKSSRRGSAAIFEIPKVSVSEKNSRRSSTASKEEIEEPALEERKIELSPRGSLVHCAPPEEIEDEEENMVQLQPSAVVCSAPSEELGEDIEVICAKIPLDKQIMLSDEARSRSKDKQGKEELGGLSKELKAFVEKELGAYWQVVIVRGDFYATFSHLPDSLFQFHLNGLSYLFWKTS